jgi:cyclopropane fatty-acyl-phospholipid synthase-like methyltransferase
MKNLEIRDYCRANFNKYTREAFNSIPKIDNPEILDLGCGTGVPTIELAKLTNGNILAIDTDKVCLDWFQQKIRQRKLEKRISIIHDSVFHVKLPENKYDIILAEGLFHIIGFDKCLASFSKLLKEHGYFIIHDECCKTGKKLYIIEKHGFKLVKSITLDEKIWWNDYFRCLEKRISDYEAENRGNVTDTDIFIREKSEIRLIKKDPLKAKSVFYVIRKM